MDKVWRENLLVGVLVVATAINAKIIFNSFENVWSDFSDFATVFIALLALITAFYASYLQRIHNYKSTKPLIDFNYSSDESERFMRVYLRNRGFGPAEIISYEVKDIDTGKIFSRNREFQEFGNSILGEKVNIGATFLEKDDVVNNSDEETLVSVVFKDESDVTMQQVKNFVLGFKITVTYTDVYERYFSPKVLKNDHKRA